MSSSQPPTKRAKFDLTTTFEVEVGDARSSQQRFTVYANVLTSRSEFFRASRSSQWLTDPTKPVDLKDEDPEIFSLYLNCVYFGVEAVQLDQKSDDKDNAHSENQENAVVGDGKDAFDISETDFRARLDAEDEQTTELDLQLRKDYQTLIKLYLLADKLQDPTTANIVMDEMVRYEDVNNRNPTVAGVNLAYKATVHGNPLRKFIRDCFIHEYESSYYMDMHFDAFPNEFYRDITVQYFKLKVGNASRTVEDVYSAKVIDIYNKDKCHYHQHDDKHPRCEPKPAVADTKS